MTALALVQAAPRGDVQSAAEARFHLFGDYFLADPIFLVLVPFALLVSLSANDAVLPTTASDIAPGDAFVAPHDAFEH